MFDKIEKNETISPLVGHLEICSVVDLRGITDWWFSNLHAAKIKVSL